ncbi:hypothetical protein [Arenibaculum pallidiluteum]|uniref:hypothetical protein n=1 Tax=Arenibaculum pallidiluteum TaxID=2812559 RepID=UPI001A95A79E|nr:hypothetical protein [Arenibaculum pallidiluteum]
MEETNLDFAAGLPEAAPAPEVSNGPGQQAGAEVGTGGRVPEDDTDEVEHEGQKYRLPKALKGALMMQADYTRKTQEVAETRRALEQRERTLAQQAQALGQDFQERARLVALDDEIERYRAVDWQQLEAEDPARAQSLWRQYQQVKEARQELAGHLLQREQQRSEETQRERARRLQEAQDVLAREIRGWGPELQEKLTEFGTRQGYRPDELAGVEDPRAVRILHLAWIGQQLLEKQIAAAKDPPAPQAVPVTQVGRGRTPATRDPERMGIEDWMRHRNAQLERRR